jgi:pimeloyl-ACP methyl ester carboxylesterase
MDFPAAAELITQWEWGPTAPEEVKQLGKQQLLASNPRVLLDDYRACDAFDVRAQLDTLTAPALIIAGEVDQLTPLKHSTFMAEHLPSARLVVAPNAGHMVMLEAEDLVTQATAAFLRDQLAA